MHPFVLIPLSSAVAAVALGGAIGARDRRNPANQRMCVLLLATAAWSILAVLWCTSEGREEAALLVKLGGIPALLIAPFAFHTILSLERSLIPRYQRWLRLGDVATGLFAALWIGTPWLVTGVVATEYGWSPRFGSATLVVCGVLIVAPVAALVESALRRRRAARPVEKTTWIHASVAIPFGVAWWFDLILPWHSHAPTPPLGPAAIVCWGGVVWWFVYRFRSAPLSAERFAHEILETLPEGIVLLRSDGSIRATNERLGQMVGSPASALLGRPVEELLSSPPLGGRRSEGDLRCELFTAEGGRLPVSVCHAPLRDEAGSTLGFVLAVRDLRELTSLRSQLVTSGRLAAVGQLAAGIAHEINNPIAYVRSNLAFLAAHWQGLAERAAKLGPRELGAPWLEGPEILAECLEGVDRVTAIVRDVGGLAERGPAVLEEIDVNDLLDTAVRVAAPQLRQRAVVERAYAAHSRVRCVPRELLQVFLNLLLNAAQSMCERGSIRLATGTDAEGVWIHVEDDGGGICPEVIERVFDPFFTTKPAGEGTGLGLSISRQIVGKYGGEIGAEAREGGGSRFWIRLPSCEEMPEQQETEPARAGLA